MAKTVYKKKIKNGKEYYFFRLRHKNLKAPKDIEEDPKTVQELLGHSNIAITLDTYTHVLDSMKKKAISKLNDLYNYMGAK